jgi:hypothetical protein
MPKTTEIPCLSCDHLCEQQDDGECVGRMTPDERAAFYQYLTLVTPVTVPMLSPIDKLNQQG